MDKKIPKPFKNIFITWEDYRDWSMEKVRTILKFAFEKYENNNR